MSRAATADCSAALEGLDLVHARAYLGRRVGLEPGADVAGISFLASVAGSTKTCAMRPSTSSSPSRRTAVAVVIEVVPRRVMASSTSISSSKRAGARKVAPASTTTTSVPSCTTLA